MTGSKNIAAKASRQVRQIDSYANDIAKCLEGMPCDDCREQVSHNLNQALQDIEMEKCMLRLALSRIKSAMSPRVASHV